MAFKMIRPMIKGSPIHKASIAKAKSNSIVANTRTSADPSLIGAADALGRSMTPGAIDYTLTSKDLKFREREKQKKDKKGKIGESKSDYGTYDEYVADHLDMKDKMSDADKQAYGDPISKDDWYDKKEHENVVRPEDEVVTETPVAEEVVAEEGRNEVAGDEVIEPIPSRGYQQPETKRKIEQNLQLATREAPVTPGYNDEKEVVTDVPKVEDEGNSTTGEVVDNPEGKKKNLVTKIKDAYDSVVLDIANKKKQNQQEWDEKQLEKEKIKAQKELEKLEEAKAEAARLKDVETANALEAEIQNKKDEADAKEAEAQKITKAIDYEFEDETSDLQAPEVDFKPRPKSDIKVDPGLSPEEIEQRKENLIEIPPIAPTQLPTNKDEELMLPTTEAPKSSEISEAHNDPKYKYDPNTMTTIEGQLYPLNGTTRELPPNPQADYEMGVVSRGSHTYGPPGDEYKYRTVTMKNGEILEEWTYNNNVIPEDQVFNKVGVDAYTHIMQQQVDDQNQKDKEKENKKRANDPILKQILENEKSDQTVIGPKQAALQMRDDRIWRNATDNGTVRQSMRNNGYVPFNER